MKFILAVGLAFGLMQTVWADDNAVSKPGSLAYLDAQYGFRDLKFEQAFETCKDLTLLETDGDLKFYKRESDAFGARWREAKSH